MAFQALRHPDAWEDQHEETSEISPHGWDSTAKSGVQVVLFFQQCTTLPPTMKTQMPPLRSDPGSKGVESLPPWFFDLFCCVYPSSHNHGSVENGCISNSSFLAFEVVFFHLHDYGRKGSGSCCPLFCAC